MSAFVVPGEAPVEVLTRARSAVAEAMGQATGTDAYHAAREALAGFSDPLAVAAVLACIIARPGDILLTVAEWHVLAGHLGLDP